MEEKQNKTTQPLSVDNSSTPIPNAMKDSHLPVQERKGFYLIIALGSLMAFQAGFINVIAILNTGVTISHNTGTTSKLGISIARWDVNGISIGFLLLLAFFLGSFLVGFFIRKKVFHPNRKYGFFLCFQALNIYIFKRLLDANSKNWGLLFGTFACGVQNALLTNLSGSVVRTSHVTGLLTDIGLLLGYYFRGREPVKDLWRLKVLIPIVCFFLFGGFVSTICYEFLNYQALDIPVFFITLLGVIIIIWRLLKRYKYDKLKNLKKKLLDIPAKQDNTNSNYSTGNATIKLV